eukprot:TRINITY_DN22015_c0_g1_i1.p1 TRINITY_DN22015_c0_g1~~TRINITY_DN22015_c0_g1_i1.p1  ORF type:complete len:628 (+),score=157.10 TRINITY_DN22015_c0_g1_i1:267-2150(+)
MLAPRPTRGAFATTPFALLLALALFDGIAPAAAWYLPGALPREYNDGDNVDVDVNVMSSVHTHLPYKYYSLPFCQPPHVQKNEGETLGEILMGDRIERSPYEYFPMSRDIVCHVVCPPKKYTKAQMEQFIDRIRDEYTVNLLLDNLPVSVPNPDERTFSMGIPLGARDVHGNYVLFNHYHFIAKYHEEANGQKRVVAFQARPYSVRHTKASCGPNFDPAAIGVPVVLPQVDEVTWSYSVTWERSTERWATRWDAYLNVSDSEVHGWAILNSLLIVFFLTGMVAIIMTRTLRGDIARYNALADAEDFPPDETGWKLVHDQVFRAPPGLSLLAAYAGTGVQLIGMTFAVLLFATLGFLSPASRGALLTAMMLCFVFLGVYSGFTSARLMKTMGRPSWRNTLLTATMVPGQLFVIFLFVNFFVWRAKSAAAVPFSTLLILILLWFCVEVPFVFIGSVLGYKRSAISIPVRTSAIPRYIPEQPWYLRPVYTVMMGGVLPFGAVFIELFFILTSLWLSRYYYVFPSLFVVFLILIVTCAEITVVMLYFQLCSEDYRWWWRSFFTSGVSAIYVFIYCASYFAYSLRITKPVPIIMYFGYMGAISYVFFVVTGTVGFLAAFMFVRKIYGSIRID